MIKNNNNSFSSVYDETTVIGKIYKGTLKVYEGWRNLIASGVPPLTLLNCKGVDLVNYKLYGNSVQDGTPTPDAPIEVESVGDKTKNLINENSVFSAKNIFFGVKDLNNYNTLEAGTYTFSIVCSDGGATNLYVVNSDTNANILVKYGVKNITFTLTETTNIKIKAYDNRFVSKEDIVSFQLEIGETATEHEPYNKYKIPVKVSGKNLLIESEFGLKNSNNGLTAEYEGNGTFHVYGEHTAGSSSSSFYFLNKAMPVPIDADKLYTFSATLLEGSTTHTVVPYVSAKNDSNASKNYLACQIYNTTKVGETVTKAYKPNVFLSDATSIKNFWIYISVPAGETIKVDCRFQVWLEKGGISTYYESYVEPIITNIYLDEPLRKIKEYADYIDFKNKKVVRNITIKVFDGTETISVPSTTIKGFTPFRYLGNTSSGKYPYLCNYLEYSGVYYSSNNKECLSIYNANINGQMFFIISNDRIPLNDIDSFKNWLAELYTKGNPLIVHYCLQTPKEETIELPNIPTIKGTTILEVDTKVQPSNLEVVYKGKK